MPKWTDVVEMKFEIELLDGMRIGGAGGGLEIGGVDPNLMALKDPVSGQPYIPGSSLKGKLRSTLEKQHGLGQNGNPCRCGQPACIVCPVFGAHMNTNAGTARLTVRDAHFTEAYRALWTKRAAEGLQIFEVKTENIIDRSRGTAQHPRTQERVPAGAMFGSEILLKVFEGDADKTAQWVSNLRNALGILQQCDSLGAGGSRGSGRIAIRNFREKKIALSSITV
jgi:CRISPR-associated protein Csm3